MEMILVVASVDCSRKVLATSSSNANFHTRFGPYVIHGFAFPLFLTTDQLPTFFSLWECLVELVRSISLNAFRATSSGLFGASGILRYLKGWKSSRKNCLKILKLRLGALSLLKIASPLDSLFKTGVIIRELFVHSLLFVDLELFLEGDPSVCFIWFWGSYFLHCMQIPL
ncbi:hypothetical protein ACS0TY_030636 [Phlomoides rotata]